MGALTFAVLAILVLFILILIVLFGDLPQYRETIVYKIRTHVISMIGVSTNVLSQIDEKLFGNVITKVTTHPTMLRMYGWIVPVMYIVVFSKCLSLFIEYTYFNTLLKFEDQFMEYKEDPRFWILIVPSIVFNLLVFALAVTTSPGDVSRIFVEQRDGELLDKKLVKVYSLFPHDELIFPQRLDHQCRTCHIPKIPRSKHCSKCGTCICMFDHHCVWLNNCVGYKNYRWFLAFLVSCIWIYAYGAYLCWRSLQLVVANYAALSTRFKLDIVVRERFRTQLDTPVWLKYWWVITDTNKECEITGILLILCVLFIPLVGFFLAEHLWYIYLGVTTNETLKWDYIQHLVETKCLYRYESKDEKLFLVRDGVEFYRLSDEMIFSADVKKGKLSCVVSIDELENVYDKGFWNNLKERLFIEYI